MLLKCCIQILIFSVISFLIALLGSLLTYFLQGENIAYELFTSYVYYFNGVVVGGVGYGLLWFIKDRRKWLINLLNNMLVFDEGDRTKILYFEKKVNFLVGNIISIPITIIGGTILWNCGYPLEGFAKYFLAAASISLYYAGGSMLAFFILSARIFLYLEENEDRVMYDTKTSPIHLETFSSYFIIISTVGILALYIAFRGTLTANFTIVSDDNIIKTFLIFPIVLFSVAPLLYSFYPRYVIKRIYDKSIIKRIADFEEINYKHTNSSVTFKEKLELEKLLLDIKESINLERSKLSIFSFKDIPSILLIIIMFIQVIIPNDRIVRSFLESLFK